MGIFDAIGGLIGGFMSSDAAESQRAAENDRFIQNLAAQKDFAQNAIRWKVDDANRAGVSPLAALGAQTISFSPIALGDIGSDLKKSAGQDISRAVAAVGNSEDRDRDFTQATQALTLERGKLENELLKSQIVRARQQLGPPNAAVSPKPAGANSLPPAFGGDVPLLKPDASEAAPLPEKEGLRIGKTWLHNPYFSDSQNVEDRYGDIGEEVYGSLIAAPADLYWNVVNSPFWLSNVTAPVDRYRRRNRGDWFVSKRYRD